MEAENGHLKWEGKVIAEVEKPTAEEVWPLLEDFFALHKWLPTIDTCSKVDELVRYCSTTLPAATDGGEPVVKWCREKLTGIDPVAKWLRYEIMDNNMGMKSYESTLKVGPIKGGDDLGLGCQIEWSFVADPIEGFTCQDLTRYLAIALQGMANNIDKAFQSA